MSLIGMLMSGKDIEEKSNQELFKQAQRDKLLFAILFSVFSFLFAVGIVTSYYIDQLLCILVSCIFVGQVLILIVILWFYGRIVLFLKMHIEE